MDSLIGLLGIVAVLAIYYYFFRFVYRFIRGVFRLGSMPSGNCACCGLKKGDRHEK